MHNETDTFDRIISTLNELERSGNFVYRGYGKIDELYPSIIRDKDLQGLESKLLCDFEKYGSNYFNAATPIDFMSYAQHFGLPTRLLDFTRNPYIALSFALYMPKSNKYKNEKDKDYYYIRFTDLDKNLCISSLLLNEDMYNNNITRTDSLATRACQSIDKVTDLFGKNVLNRTTFALDNFKGSLANTVEKQNKIRDKTILFIDPNQSNQRIIMQQGLFMFPYTLNKDEHLDILERNTSVVMIHKTFRQELMNYLDTLGFNTFRLMPDLSSICEAVKRRAIDERSRKSELFGNNDSNLHCQFYNEK